MLFNGDEKKINAYEELKKMGVLIPLDSVELYHGRANNNQTKDWRVIAGFNNAGDVTGNQNVNKVPALNLADKQIASEFAKARAYFGGKNEEVHKIVSTDPYACCFDLTKSNLIRDPEIAKLIKGLMCPPVAKNAISIPFVDKETFDRVINDFSKNSLYMNLINRKSIADFAHAQNYTEEEKTYLSQIASASNSMLMCRFGYLDVALFDYLSGTLQKKDKDGEIVDLSSEYISSFIAENHIIGVHLGVNSATLGKRIGAYQIFDLKKINTEKVVGDMLRRATDTYSPISQYLSTKIKDEKTKNALTNSPEAIIKYVMSKSPTIKEEFEGDVGVWERFNLGEHTESVMRFFDENFAPYLPEETKSIMNLLILCHDIGKAESERERVIRNSEKDIENYKKNAQTLCGDLGVDKSFGDFAIDFLRTQKYTTDYYVRKDPSALSNLQNICNKLTNKYNMPDRKNFALSLSQLARMLQTCDSGAYTLYGKTREWDTKHYYQNGNEDWTKNFVKTEQGYRFDLDAKLTKVQGMDVVETQLM